jgi:hypothetical protein
MPEEERAEGGRLDFYFDCSTGDDLSTCPYRLIVRFGIYDRKADVVVFDLGHMLLFTTGPDGSQIKEGSASFSIAFQAEENCKNGKDDDGDGYIDCPDPDCDGNRFCR